MNKRKYASKKCLLFKVIFIVHIPYVCKVRLRYFIEVILSKKWIWPVNSSFYKKYRIHDEAINYTNNSKNWSLLFTSLVWKLNFFIFIIIASSILTRTVLLFFAPSRLASLILPLENKKYPLLDSHSKNDFISNINIREAFG